MRWLMLGTAILWLAACGKAQDMQSPQREKMVAYDVAAPAPLVAPGPDGGAQPAPAIANDAETAKAA